MKHRIAIFLLSIIAVITCQAAVITVTVASKTAAEVTGDETEKVEAEFSTTSNYKDRITADNQATLTLLHVPHGQIDYIAVYVHSNKTSGAGSLSLKLNGVSIASVADKKFSEWPGQTAYTAEYVPVWFNGPWDVEDETTLTLQINASANSLYLSHMEVSFTKGAVKPYTVTFNWNTSEGDKTTTLTEKSIGSGILLPQCQLTSFVLDGEEWAFVGWSKERVVAKMKAEPALLYAGKMYYPSQNTSLYAIYKTVSETEPIMQDTLYESGMYAMVMVQSEGNYYMATGTVENKQIMAKPCNVEMQADGRYRLMQNYVPADARYEVIFDEQTLTITNLNANSPIGYSSTYLATNNNAWEWCKRMNHSTAMYFASSTNGDALTGRLLMPIAEDATKLAVFQARLLNIIADYEYILLFDVMDISTVPYPESWTSHPFGYNAIRLVKQNAPAMRKMMHNGIMLIEKDGVFYDVQGRNYND